MYTHKVGRTARAGKPGVALSLVVDGSESTAIESVVDNLKKEVASWEFLPITSGREPNHSIGEIKYGDHSIAPKPGRTDKTFIFEWHKDACEDPLQAFIKVFKKEATVPLNLSTGVRFQADETVSIIGESGFKDMDQPTKDRFEQARFAVADVILIPEDAEIYPAQLKAYQSVFILSKWRPNGNSSYCHRYTSYSQKNLGH
jgi:superfamily II DNA/RNA helicase